MNKIQPTKFLNIGEFLDSLSEDELKIVERLRSLIFEALPECEEKLAYNVPFYYRHTRICFIWPASIPWGGVDAGVAIGFCRGNLITDNINYLEKGNRKEVYTKTFVSEKQIEPGLLKSFLFEVKEIDDTLSKA